MSSRAPKVDPGSKLVFLLSAVALLAAVYVLVTSLVNTVKRNTTKGVVDKSAYIVSAASENLKPTGASSTSDTVAAAAPAAARSGKEVYTAVCGACHNTGAAGAPKVGDKAAWEPRVATGLDALMSTAINGKGAMPARGGQNVGDAELKATILYMTKETGFDLGGAAEAPAKKAEPAAAPEAKKEEAKKEEPAKEEVKIVEAPKAPKEPEAPKQPAIEKTEVAAAATTAAVAAAPVVAKAASGADGKALYASKGCGACHGADAKTPIMAQYPKIAGQGKAYVTQQLKDIKSGKRSNGMSAAMKGIMASVSDEEIEPIAEYIASMK